MPTSKADRLNKLFDGEALPPPPEPHTSHIADTEITSRMPPAQQPWAVPRTAQTPRKVARSPHRNQRAIEQFTSSDDDDYIRAFKKSPKLKSVMPPSPSKVRSRPDGDQDDHRSRPRATAPTADAANACTGERRDNGISTRDSHGNALVARFCPFNLVTKFCYKYMEDPNDRVSKHFFASERIWNRTWNIYYIHPPASISAKPIILVPEHEVQQLLTEINSAFKISIDLPPDPFLLTFYQDDTPNPTQLGVSTSRHEVQEMEQKIIPPDHDHGECPPHASQVLQDSFEDFKALMQRVIEQNKRKATALKKAKAKDRLASQVKQYEALKRGQRYLGLRPLDCRGGLPVPDPSLPWEEQQSFEREQKVQYGHVLTPLDLKKPAPHPFDRDAIFVSIDVEAFERDHSKIMEVGISTLDTVDIKHLPPGEGGSVWMKQIRSRHFRIMEHADKRNTSFCLGDPDRFLFGRSEFFSMNDIGLAIDSCFQPPYSADAVHDGEFRAAGEKQKQETGGTVEGQIRGNFSSVTQTAGPEGGVGSKLTSEPIDVHGPTNRSQDQANRTAVSHILSSPGLPGVVTAQVSSSDTGPFTARSEVDDSNINQQKVPQKQPKYRNIILVGHDIDADLNYLSTLQSAIFTNPPTNTYPQPLEPENPLRKRILESLDTATLYKVWKRETNLASLAKVLIGVERSGWGLHNGGNDARYTMEALIGILVCSRVEEDEVYKAASGDDAMATAVEKRRQEEKEEMKKAIKERQAAVEREELENAAMRVHAMGAYGGKEEEETWPDPYVGAAEQAVHNDADVLQRTAICGSETVDTATATASLDRSDTPSSTAVNQAEPSRYSWSSVPPASRDGGEPKGFQVPGLKSSKSSDSSNRHPVSRVEQNESDKGDSARLKGDDTKTESPRRLNRTKQMILEPHETSEVEVPTRLMSREKGTR